MNESRQDPQESALCFSQSQARRLAGASRRMGRVEALGKTWSAWQGFSGLPLRSLAALCEVELRGHDLDLARLLALGPRPSVSRPDLPLRWGVGVSLALTRLESWALKQPLTPSLVTFIHETVDAPQLSRGMRADLSNLREQTADPVPGAAPWSLAPGWVKQGMPPLWAAGRALAQWEASGPDDERRSITGRVLLHALAPRLGITSAALVFLAPSLMRAAQAGAGGWRSLVRELRRGGEYDEFIDIFLAALAISATRVVSLAGAVSALHNDHREVVKNWVRAPRHPLRLMDLALSAPVLDLPGVARDLEVTQRTAGLLVEKLAKQDILKEITGQRRGRRFAYAPLMEYLQPGWGEPEPE